MVKELVRVGIVTQVYPERGSARVKIAGVDDSVSYEMPVVVKKTCKDKDYWMPDVGEHVVCLFSGQGLEQGYILGAIYSQADNVPVSSREKWYQEFADGTVIEYDRAAHKLMAQVQGDVELTASGKCDISVAGDLAARLGGKATIQAANIEATATVMAKITAPAITLAGAITVQGDLEVQGNVNATGQVMDQTGNTAHHNH